MLPSLEEMFTYHAPNAEQVGQMQALRELGLALARAIDATGMHVKYRDEALMGLHRVTMLANAGVVLLGGEG